MSAASWLRPFFFKDAPMHIQVITCKTQPGKNRRSKFIAHEFWHHHTFGVPNFVGVVRKLALSHFTPENKKTHRVVCKESNPRSVGLVLVFITNKENSEEALRGTLGKYKTQQEYIYTQYVDRVQRLLPPRIGVYRGTPTSGLSASKK